MDRQSLAGLALPARDELLAALDCPAMIVDSRGAVLQANDAARILCDAIGDHGISGVFISALLPALADYLPLAAAGFDTHTAVECPALGANVRVRGASISDARESHESWLMLLQADDALTQQDDASVRALLASMDDLVFVIDFNGFIVEYHQQSSDIRDSVTHLMLGRSYQEVFDDAVARTYAKMMDIVRATGEMQRFDHRFDRNGREYWYSANMGLHRDQNQNAAGFLVVSRNITERKRIETTACEQRAFAEALQDVALALNSTLELDEILDRILANVVRVVPADTAAILLVDHGVATVAGARGYTERGLADYVSQYQVEVTAMDRLQYMSRTRQPCLIPDVRMFQNWLHCDSLSPNTGCEMDPSGQPSFAVAKVDGNWSRSYLGAPIVLDDDVIGFIKLESAVVNHFTDAHADRLRAFCNHAASAIRNARLYTKAQELAAVEERQRLARELHDAVSQMLFSAKIIAEMLPRLQKKDPDSVWPYLSELQRLIQGAMGEMRMLLLELRPNILSDVDLRVLLGYLVDAASARTSARITLSAPGECSVPAPVQTALYRIAQESLANAVKYAHAENIEILVQRKGNQICMHVQDDGAGFETGDVRPENLGLDIMQERAEEIGARLYIDSAPRKGSTVKVVWPALHTASERGRRDA